MSNTINTSNLTYPVPTHEGPHPSQPDYSLTQPDTYKPASTPTAEFPITTEYLQPVQEHGVPHSAAYWQIEGTQPINPGWVHREAGQIGGRINHYGHDYRPVFLDRLQGSQQLHWRGVTASPSSYVFGERLTLDGQSVDVDIHLDSRAVRRLSSQTMDHLNLPSTHALFVDGRRQEVHVNLWRTPLLVGSASLRQAYLVSLSSPGAEPLFLLHNPYHETLVLLPPSRAREYLASRPDWTPSQIDSPTPTKLTRQPLPLGEIQESNSRLWQLLKQTRSVDGDAEAPDVVHQTTAMYPQDRAPEASRSYVSSLDRASRRYASEGFQSTMPRKGKSAMARYDFAGYHSESGAEVFVERNPETGLPVRMMVGYRNPLNPTKFLMASFLDPDGQFTFHHESGIVLKNKVGCEVSYESSSGTYGRRARYDAVSNAWFLRVEGASKRAPYDNPEPLQQIALDMFGHRLGDTEAAVEAAAAEPVPDPQPVQDVVTPAALHFTADHKVLGTARTHLLLRGAGEMALTLTSPGTDDTVQTRLGYDGENFTWGAWTYVTAGTGDLVPFNPSGELRQLTPGLLWRPLELFERDGQWNCFFGVGGALSVFDPRVDSRAALSQHAALLQREVVADRYRFLGGGNDETGRLHQYQAVILRAQEDLYLRGLPHGPGQLRRNVNGTLNLLWNDAMLTLPVIDFQTRHDRPGANWESFFELREGELTFWDPNTGLESSTSFEPEDSLPGDPRYFVAAIPSLGIRVVLSSEGQPRIFSIDETLTRESIQAEMAKEREENSAQATPLANSSDTIDLRRRRYRDLVGETPRSTLLEELHEPLPYTPFFPDTYRRTASSARWEDSKTRIKELEPLRGHRRFQVVFDIYGEYRGPGPRGFPRVIGFEFLLDQQGLMTVIPDSVRMREGGSGGEDIRVLPNGCFVLLTPYQRGSDRSHRIRIRPFFFAINPDYPLRAVVMIKKAPYAHTGAHMDNIDREINRRLPALWAQTDARNGPYTEVTALSVLQYRRRIESIPVHPYRLFSTVVAVAPRPLSEFIYTILSQDQPQTIGEWETLVEEEYYVDNLQLRFQEVYRGVNLAELDPIEYVIFLVSAAYHRHEFGKGGGSAEHFPQLTDARIRQQISQTYRAREVATAEGAVAHRQYFERAQRAARMRQLETFMRRARR